MQHNEYSGFSPEDPLYNDREARARRARRIQQMKKAKKRRIFFLKCQRIALFAGIFLLAAFLIISRIEKKSSPEEPEELWAETIPEESIPLSPGIDAETEISPEVFAQEDLSSAELPSVPTPPADSEAPAANLETSTPQITYSAAVTDATRSVSSEVVSENALFISLDTDTILAERAAHTIIDPASMTKVLTILVAAEHITEEQLDDTFTMTLDITDYSYVNDCSNAGFLENEVLTVRDLFYGTILPSGADAAVGLATYVAGSHEAFVELMNDKLEALGLSDTAHMTNCVGIYNPEHACTLYDMAMIMEAALDNDLCREVLGTRIYTTTSTAQHPEGITLSNWFIRRIEDKDTGGKILGAKTGYVNQSGSCAVSYGVDHAGKEYVCVTAHSTSSWRCIYDHVALYKMFATESE